MRMIVPAILTVVLTAQAFPAETRPEVAGVPGVVIDYSPAASGRYIGSPSIVVLPNGSYLASHDFFGPKTTEFVSATTAIFGSDDRGKTWRHKADIEGAFWSSLFAHGNSAYLIGPTAHHGKLVIRRSTDGGATWTQPRDVSTGLLREGQFHCAPMPVIEYKGRIWRAIEDAAGGKEWGKRYRAMMLSAPVDADLLSAASWTSSNYVARDPSWLDGHFNAWLEGNAVVAPDGGMLDILRVDAKGVPEQCAIINISADGAKATFDPAAGFARLPGGSTKFAIRFDPTSRLYWTLSNARVGVGAQRNTLALMHSTDLHSWQIACYLLHHPESKFHAFQYVDWLIDGDDMIAVSRTAFDDGRGGAHSFHDANFLTFHRFSRFRSLTMADSAPGAVPAK